MNFFMKFLSSFNLTLAVLMLYMAFTSEGFAVTGLVGSLFLGVMGIACLRYKGQNTTARHSTSNAQTAQQLAQGLGMIASAMQASNKKKSTSKSSYQPPLFGSSPNYSHNSKEAANRVSKVANENYAKSQAARKQSPAQTQQPNQRTRDEEILEKNRNAAIQQQMRDEGKWS